MELEIENQTGRAIVFTSIKAAGTAQKIGAFSTRHVLFDGEEAHLTIEDGKTVYRFYSQAATNGHLGIFSEKLNVESGSPMAVLTRAIAAVKFVVDDQKVTLQSKIVANAHE